MNITAPADLEAEILRQRERLTETVGALTERFEDFDVVGRAEEVLGRAESSATDLIDASTDDDGRPKPAIVIGGALAVIAVVVLLRRRNRAKQAAAAARPTTQGAAA